MSSKQLVLSNWVVSSPLIFNCSVGLLETVFDSIKGGEEEDFRWVERIFNKWEGIQ